MALNFGLKNRFKEGLREQFAEINCSYRLRDGVQVYPISREAEMQAIIDAYDPLPNLKKAKHMELHGEAVRRMSLIYSFIDDPDYYLFLRDIYTSMKPNARDPLSGNLLQIKDIKDAFDAAKTAINAEAVIATVENYDVINTPDWPV